CPRRRRPSLHSFPTRRSSDLRQPVRGRRRRLLPVRVLPRLLPRRRRLRHRARLRRRRRPLGLQQRPRLRVAAGPRRRVRRTALPPPVALALTVPRAVVLAVAHTEPRAVAVALALETDGIVAGDRLRSAPVAAGHDVELVRVQDGLRRLARRARAGQET